MNCYLTMILCVYTLTLTMVFGHSLAASPTLVSTKAKKTILSTGTLTVPRINTTTIPVSARCQQKKRLFQNEGLKENKTCHATSKPLRCFHDPLFCKRYFQSGKRVLQERPVYGEYKYLDQKLWFHVIQDGGVVFLYNPCLSEKQIKKLKQLASGCLKRHVITPSEMLGDEMPIALLSWGCFYGSSSVNETKMKAWMRENTFKGPGSSLQTSGTFRDNLNKESTLVTDKFDSIVCPNETEILQFKPTVQTIIRTPENSVGDKIINHRMHVIKYGRHGSNIHIVANFTTTKVHPASAVWAASSLFFLCTILAIWFFYTKAWQPKTNRERINYPDYHGNPGKQNKTNLSSGFSLLKSSQTFINIFRTDKKREREKKLDSLSTVNLMVPINEEDEEFEEGENY